MSCAIILHSRPRAGCLPGYRLGHERETPGGDYENPLITCPGWTGKRLGLAGFRPTDPTIAEQIGALITKFAGVFNKHDAAAVAALFTEDGSYETPHGTFHGWQAIQKHCAGNFRTLKKLVVS